MGHLLAAGSGAVYAVVIRGASHCRGVYGQCLPGNDGVGIYSAQQFAANVLIRSLRVLVRYFRLCMACA